MRKQLAQPGSEPQTFYFVDAHTSAAVAAPRPTPAPSDIWVKI